MPALPDGKAADGTFRENAMLRIEGVDHGRNCAGVSRRSFLQAGLLGLGGITLADSLRLQASAAGKPGKKTACILVWLDGGPPQHETYDPKPDAPAEVRGAYGAIDTNVSGIRLCELMAAQAKVADRMAFIRSVHHDNGDHFAGAHVMLTGRWGATGADTTPRSPGIGAYVSKARGSNRSDLPPYVGIPNIHSVGLSPGYHGGNHLGAQYDPFFPYSAGGISDKVGTPTMFKLSAAEARLARRSSLLQRVDTLDRALDQGRQMESLDFFTQQAFNTLLSSSVKEAFDLDAEPEKVAERYGTHHWGRYALLARRLVERGVTFVTCNFDGWDMHDNIAAVVKGPAQRLDQAVAALVADLSERGMLDHVLVVVMGEFGRTPKLNTNGVPGQTGIPGRDHWGQAMSVAMAGGGLRMGQVVGATNPLGEYPVESPYGPEDVLATVYHVLGINPSQEFLDRTGRPIPILPGGKLIRELL